MDILSLVPNIGINVFQYLDVKSLSLSLVSPLNIS